MGFPAMRHLPRHLYGIGGGCVDEHNWWQGIEPVDVLRRRESLTFFHPKHTSPHTHFRVNPQQTKTRGKQAKQDLSHFGGPHPPSISQIPSIVVVPTCPSNGSSAPIPQATREVHQPWPFQPAPETAAVRVTHRKRARTSPSATSPRRWWRTASMPPDTAGAEEKPLGRRRRPSPAAPARLRRPSERLRAPLRRRRAVREGGGLDGGRREERQRGTNTENKARSNNPPGTIGRGIRYHGYPGITR